MIVCFPFAFKGRESEEDVRVGRAFLSRARRFQVKVVQLSDWETVNLGADCIRYPNDGLAKWYFEIMGEFPANEFLRLDTDVMIRELPTELCGGDFDIACWINKGMMNNGVVFARNKQFFRDCYKAWLHTSQDNWNDIQVASQKVIDSGKYKVLKLDPKYNYMPKAKGEYEGARLVHFEGAERKAWIT